MSAAGSVEGADAAREWLGGEAGGRALRADLVEIMMAGFEHEPAIWTLDDVKALDEVKASDVTDMKALWAAYLVDSADVSADHELNSSIRR